MNFLQPIDSDKKCTVCKVNLPDCFFIARGQKLHVTKTCYFCRKKVFDKTQLNQDFNYYKDRWGKFKEQACVDCGLRNSVVIQADHRKNLGEKVQKCSNYYYWKSKHSKEAYELELKKCEPRCRFCHFMRTDRDNWFSYGTHGRQLYHKKKKQHLVLQEKLHRGSCAICARKVTVQNARAFIFDHGVNRMKRNCGVSTFITHNNCSFETAEKILLQEMLLCRLLCSNCDWEHTKEELWGKERTPIEAYTKSIFLKE